MTRARWSLGLVGWWAFGCAVVACAAAVVAWVATTVHGAGLPVPVLHARVVSVPDGDTVRVVVDLGVGGVTADVRVRLAGIDAPETKGRCPEETAKAAAATAALRDLVQPHEVVAVVAPYEDKFAGRVVARLVKADGTDVGTVLAARGLVRPYDGKGARGSWCPSPTTTTTTTTATTTTQARATMAARDGRP